MGLNDLVGIECNSIIKEAEKTRDYLSAFLKFKNLNDINRARPFGEGSLQAALYAPIIRLLQSLPPYGTWRHEGQKRTTIDSAYQFLQYVEGVIQYQEYEDQNLPLIKHWCEILLSEACTGERPNT